MMSLLAGRVESLPTTLTVAGRPIRLTKLLRQMPGRREVWQAERDGSPLLLKCFAETRAGERDFNRELTGFENWQQRGVPAPALIFVTEMPVRVIAAEWLPGIAALDLYRVAVDRRQRVALARDLVEFTARQLQVGCEQRDIHLGNFICIDDEWRMIDAAACRFYSDTTPAKAVHDNLAALLAQFRIDTALAVIDDLDKLAIPVDADRLRQQCITAARRRHARAAAKSLRNCTEFAEIRSNGLTGIARRTDWALVESMVHRGIDGFVESGEPLKLGGSSTVARVNVDGRELVIKRYNTKSMFHRLKKMVTRSRARKSWQNAVWLRSAEIGTPRPIAFLEQHRFASKGLAWFVTEPAVGPDLLSVSEKVLILNGVAERLADLLRKMQLLRFSHGDFKATNLLLEHDELIVIDLDAMRRQLSAPRASRLIGKDTARLRRNWPKGRFREALDLELQNLHDGTVG